LLYTWTTNKIILYYFSLFIKRNFSVKYEAIKSISLYTSYFFSETNGNQILWKKKLLLEFWEQESCVSYIQPPPYNNQYLEAYVWSLEHLPILNESIDVTFIDFSPVVSEINRWQKVYFHIFHIILAVFWKVAWKLIKMFIRFSNYNKVILF